METARSIIDELATKYDRLEDVPHRDLRRYAAAYHQESEATEMFADASGVRCLGEIIRLVDEADDYWESGRVFADHMIATSNIKDAFALAKIYLPSDEYDESNDPRFEEELDSLPIG